MYDAEIMNMLCLIHSENAMIVKLLLLDLSEEERKKLTFKPYQDVYNKIIESLNEHSPCLECDYKSQIEKMKNIMKSKD